LERAMEEMTGVGRNDMIGQGDHAYTVPFYVNDGNSCWICSINMIMRIVSNYQYVQRKEILFYAEIFTPALRGGKGAYVGRRQDRYLNVQGRQNRLHRVDP